MPPHDPPHAPQRDLGGHYDPKHPDKRRWALEQHNLVMAIFERYPEAAKFSPCDCGLAVAVIPRGRFNPACHYLIDDAELLDFARAFLRGSIYSNYDGPDGVLILGERA